MLFLKTNFSLRIPAECRQAGQSGQDASREVPECHHSPAGGTACSNLQAQHCSQSSSKHSLLQPIGTTLFIVKKKAQLAPTYRHQAQHCSQSSRRHSLFQPKGTTQFTQYFPCTFVFLRALHFVFHFFLRNFHNLLIQLSYVSTYRFFFKYFILLKVIIKHCC